MASWVSLLDIIYPVGSYYFSANSFSPSSTVGGTWSQIPAGTFVCSAGSDYPANSTGGSNSVTLTIDEIPNHSHDYMYDKEYGWEPSAACEAPVWGYAEQTTGIQTGSIGGGKGHENRPQYIAAYIWRRIS